jgi:2-keto-4-pentenoate hydratase
VGFAYEVQDRLVAHWRQSNDDVIFGWKLGMTTAKMRTLTGICEPAAGAILARRAHWSGAVLARSKLVHLGLEGEIAVRVGEGFPETAGVDPAQAMDRLDAIAAAFEISDDRHADWERLEAASLIADNIWNMGVVIGPATPARGFGSLMGRCGIVTVNGELRDHGVSEDVGGDPLALVAWLGAHLARRGRPLQPGQWIMTGSFVPTRFPEAGERYRFAVDGLEPVEAIIG